MNEIATWLAISGAIVTRDELNIIRRIDAAYVAAVCKERSDQIARETGKGGGS